MFCPWRGSWPTVEIPPLGQGWRAWTLWECCTDCLLALAHHRNNLESQPRFHSSETQSPRRMQYFFPKIHGQDHPPGDKTSWGYLQMRIVLASLVPMGESPASCGLAGNLCQARTSRRPGDKKRLKGLVSLIRVNQSFQVENSLGFAWRALSCHQMQNPAANLYIFKMLCNPHKLLIYFFPSKHFSLIIKI